MACMLGGCRGPALCGGAPSRPVRPAQTAGGGGGRQRRLKRYVGADHGRGRRVGGGLLAAAVQRRPRGVPPASTPRPRHHAVTESKDRVARRPRRAPATTRHPPPAAHAHPTASLAPRGRGRGVGRPVQARRVDPDRAHALGRAQVVIHDAGRHRNDVVALHGVGNGRGRGWESVRAVGSRAPRSAARHRRPSRRAPAHSTAPSTPPPSSPVSPSST